MKLVMKNGCETMQLVEKRTGKRLENTITARYKDDSCIELLDGDYSVLKANPDEKICFEFEKNRFNEVITKYIYTKTKDKITGIYDIFGISILPKIDNITQINGIREISPLINTFDKVETSSILDSNFLSIKIKDDKSIIYSLFNNKVKLHGQFENSYFAFYSIYVFEVVDGRIVAIYDSREFILIEKVDNEKKDFFEVVNQHYLKEYVNGKYSRIYNLSPRKLIETSNEYELDLLNTYPLTISYGLNGRIVKIRRFDSKFSIEICKEEIGCFLEVDKKDGVIYKYNDKSQIIAIYNLASSLEEIARLTQKEINDGISLKAERIDASYDKVICKMKNNVLIAMYYNDSMKWERPKNDSTLSAEIFQLPNNKLFFRVINKSDRRCVRIISENRVIEGYRIEYITKSMNYYFYCYDQNGNLVAVYNESLSLLAKCKDEDKYIHVFDSYSEYVEYEDERTFFVETSEVDKIIYLAYQKDGKCRKVYEDNKCILDAKNETYFVNLGNDYILEYKDKHIISIYEYSYNTHRFILVNGLIPPYIEDAYYTISKPFNLFWKSLKGNIYILKKYRKNSKTIKTYHFVMKPYDWCSNGLLLQINSEDNVKFFKDSCIVVSDDKEEITIVNKNLEYKKHILNNDGKCGNILILNNKVFITEVFEGKIVALYLVEDVELKEIISSNDGIEITNWMKPYLVINNQKYNLFGNPL